MVGLVLFIFGVIGMTHIIVDSDMPFIIWFRDLIDKRLSADWAKLFHCYQCSGFWSGIICGYLAFQGIGVAGLLLAGFSGSFLASFGAMLMNYVEANSIVNLKDE